MGDFSVDVGRFVKTAKDKADKATGMIAHDLCRRVIEKTPVDEGTLRRSWTMGENTSGGNDPLSYAITMKFGETRYLVNNQPYAKVVEYGGYPNPPKGGKGKTISGYSTQAPAGMVRISIPETIAWANSLKL